MFSIRERERWEYMAARAIPFDRWQRDYPDEIMRRRIEGARKGINITVHWVVRPWKDDGVQADGDIIERPIEIAG